MEPFDRRCIKILTAANFLAMMRGFLTSQVKVLGLEHIFSWPSLIAEWEPWSCCVFGLPVAACSLLNCLAVAPANLKPRDFSNFHLSKWLAKPWFCWLDVFFPHTWDNFFRYVLASKLDLLYDLGIRFNVSKQKMQEIHTNSTGGGPNLNLPTFFPENILSLSVRSSKKHQGIYPFGSHLWLMFPWCFCIGIVGGKQAEKMVFVTGEAVCFVETPKEMTCNYLRFWKKWTHYLLLYMMYCRVLWNSHWETFFASTHHFHMATV